MQIQIILHLLMNYKNLKDNDCHQSDIVEDGENERGIEETN